MFQLPKFSFLHFCPFHYNDLLCASKEKKDKKAKSLWHAGYYTVKQSNLIWSSSSIITFEDMGSLLKKNNKERERDEDCWKKVKEVAKFWNCYNNENNLG